MKVIESFKMREVVRPVAASFALADQTEARLAEARAPVEMRL